MNLKNANTVFVIIFMEIFNCFFSLLFADRNRGGGRPVQGQQSFTCHFCKDQFRTLSVRKNHMLREHEGLLFNCGFCTFVNMYRRDLLWHLREHHRKQGYSDEMMLREFVR